MLGLLQLGYQIQVRASFVRVKRLPASFALLHALCFCFWASLYYSSYYWNINLNSASHYILSRHLDYLNNLFHRAAFTALTSTNYKI